MMLAVLCGGDGLCKSRRISYRWTLIIDVTVCRWHHYECAHRYFLYAAEYGLVKVKPEYSSFATFLIGLAADSVTPA